MRDFTKIKGDSSSTRFPFSHLEGRKKKKERRSKKKQEEARRSKKKQEVARSNSIVEKV